MDDGVYCSTAGTYFNERDALQEHYQSEFHRYNLKRKIAGLPPVTREWYEARRAQLSASAAGNLQRVWLDPLTKKKFYSENTYQAFTRSKKYQDMVKKSGKPAPPAVVTVRRLDEAAAAPAQPAAAAPAATAKPVGFVVKPAVRGGPAAAAAAAQNSSMETSQSPDADADEAASGSDWESVSEEEMEGASETWEDWDVCQSLFDNHISPSMEANLEYMWRKFGFYLPDSEYLEDPEGMLKYLGAKLMHGHIPLYESGSNPNAKQMASLHGVQRHMVDVGKCKVLYDGNEEEYEDFYNYEKEEMEVEGSTGRALAVFNGGDAPTTAGGYELALTTERGGVKVLGSREFARYYKQRHRYGDQRESAAKARVMAQYRKLSVPLLGDGGEPEVEEKKRVHRAQMRVERVRLMISIRRNANDNLPKNVPY